MTFKPCNDLPKHSSTRMHSSRMRTARSSSRHGRSPHTPRADPLEQPPPWSDPPQLPPWVWAWKPARHAGLWAWTRSPSTSPLAVGLDQIPLNFPLGCGPGNLQVMLGYHPPPPRPAARYAGIPPTMHAGIAPPPSCEQNHRCL